MSCYCEKCKHILFYPEMPSLSPLRDVSENWIVDCHWVSPFILGNAVLIHRNFITDGVSIPRLAWRIIGHPFSKDLLPHALAHDALYAAELLTRKESDDWFLESLQHGGVSFARRNAIWTAVRTGGSFVFNKHTKESINEARKYAKLLNIEDYNNLKEIKNK